MGPAASPDVAPPVLIPFASGHDSDWARLAETAAALRGLNPFCFRSRFRHLASTASPGCTGLNPFCFRSRFRHDPAAYDKRPDQVLIPFASGHDSDSRGRIDGTGPVCLNPFCFRSRFRPTCSNDVVSCGAVLIPFASGHDSDCTSRHGGILPPLS